MKWQKILIYLTVGIVIYICLFVSYFMCSDSMNKEIHLISKDYVGPVIIFYNQMGGVKREYEGKARLLRIPKCGVLYTKFKPNTGWIGDSNTINIWYVDSIDNKIMEIPFVISTLNEKVMELSNIGVNGFNYKSISLEDRQLDYMYYFVDTLNLQWSKYSRFSVDIDSLLLSDKVDYSSE